MKRPFSKRLVGFKREVSMDGIQSVGVVGAGQMGGGIGQVLCQRGFSAVLVDFKQSSLEKALEVMEKNWSRQVEKEKIKTEDRERYKSSLHLTTSMEDLGACQVIIEAATENLDLKLEIFRKLHALAPSQTLLFTNTSSLSITQIAGVTGRPDQVAGMHFMNPVPVMKLVEGIRGLQTSNTTFETVRSLAQSLGKVFVEGRDMPGFIVNRILMPMINEAVYALYEGLGQASDIDVSMELGTHQPMGPLKLADFIGLDTCLAIMNTLHQGLGDGKYRPCPLLIKYVEAGWLGKKVGKGFYEYVS